MHIDQIKLLNFRNYETLHMQLKKNFNIIYGNNAQGKTNIIEAIFLCASGRSHRTSKDSELIRFSKDGYYVKLDFHKDTISSSIEITYKTEEKKKIRINEIPVRKMGELIGHINVVIFSPEDLLIIKEGPAERRRFIDITVSQLKPSYFYDLQQYNKILLQRNSLLKEIQLNKALQDTLEVWDANLVKTGARIIRVRREFIKRLSSMAEKNHDKLTDGKEKLSIQYSPSFKIEKAETTAEIEEAFHAVLKAFLNREIAKGTTLYGPQRDDYEMILDRMNLKLYGSQGQQRTAILSIKLSEIDIIREDTEEYPVLLLDDVMSELDSSRQEYLFRNLSGIQTFITCTEKEFFEKRLGNDSGFFHVEKGVVEIG